MIPSDATLERGLRDRARAARCIASALGSRVSSELGPKIAESIAESIELAESPIERAAFFEWAHVARTKTFVNRRQMSFMFNWWRIMGERSELWRIVKSRNFPCPR